MGQHYPENDPYPLEDQVKNLADDELLDFWEEAQFIEGGPSENAWNALPASLDYERIILQELMLRSCMRGVGPR
ncbi:hypothetical protein NNJEOMEG_03677 [Fundidesulfovibrio magnetotacticus]|uniref:Uncharacterized protein n=1 Tax=Fundidesulfovibrio magnetotacticus TaxID=2730080 RepID=A0A6V8M0P1_9BACT|nr:hypothetical protein [Fundidesulfovibrio magnetotacticus]GFK95809.1 hypothetical protein NNJEOMEG_03677 [Fundidesulfovibrio magnetotacticus]